MQTKTIRILGKTLAVYGIRPRVKKYRFGVSSGDVFTGLHTGLVSRYIHFPILNRRKWGGTKDIKKGT